MNANLTDRITVNPRQCGGRPIIRGMRIRVIDVLDLLVSGMSRAEILSDYPELEAEDIDACLRFARDRIDHPVVVARNTGGFPGLVALVLRWPPDRWAAPRAGHRRCALPQVRISGGAMCVA